MLALGSAWIGLLMLALSLAMVAYRPLFHDWVLPVVLYGAVAAIALGGLVLMRKSKPGDDEQAARAQRVQAKVGVTLGIVSYMIMFVLFKLAQQISRSGG